MSVSQKRRDLLKGATWAVPASSAVVLPAHAQTSGIIPFDPRMTFTIQSVDPLLVLAVATWPGNAVSDSSSSGAPASVSVERPTVGVYVFYATLDPIYSFPNKPEYGGATVVNAAFSGFGLTASSSVELRGDTNSSKTLFRVTITEFGVTQVEVYRNGGYVDLIDDPDYIPYDPTKFG